MFLEQLNIADNTERNVDFWLAIKEIFFVYWERNAKILNNVFNSIADAWAVMKTLEKKTFLVL